MDPFRYHDTKEASRVVPLMPVVLPKNPGESNVVNSTTSHHHIKTETHCAGLGRFVITSIVETLPRPIRGPERVCGILSQSAPTSSFLRERYGSSVASSPNSVSSSPPSSVHENGFVWRNSETEGSVYGFKPYCSFCKKNGERPNIYNSHQLHCTDSNGRRVVECFVLRSVRCPLCGATGDDAHTISHCPHSSTRVPIALALKSTLRQCNGSLRKKPF